MNKDQDIRITKLEKAFNMLLEELRWLDTTDDMISDKMLKRLEKIEEFLNKNK